MSQSFARPITASSSDAAENALGLEYFRQLSLLPPTTIKQELYDVPSRDFTFAGTVTLNDRGSHILATTMTGSAAVTGWDIGSSKTEVLYILGNFCGPGGGSGNTQMVIGSAVPTTNEWPANAYCLYEVPYGSPPYWEWADWNGSSPTTFGTVADGYEIGVPGYARPSSQPVMLAMYWNGGSDVLRFFIRSGGQWREMVAAISDSHITGIRYVGIKADGTYPGGATDDNASFGCPMAVYTN